jgi:hypothetical protein
MGRVAHEAAGAAVLGVVRDVRLATIVGVSVAADGVRLALLIRQQALFE